LRRIKSLQHHGRHDTIHLTSLWRTTSAHRTSDGTVRYQSCPCGRWRVVRDRAGEVAAVLVEVRSAPVHRRAHDDTGVPG
jgi:hypothetical protein